jgi:hypothetical protein
LSASSPATIDSQEQERATVEMARRFAKDCNSSLRVHGDFIIGLPGGRKTPSADDRFRQNWIQRPSGVDRAAYPAWSARSAVTKQILIVEEMTDDHGHQLPHRLRLGRQR